MSCKDEFVVRLEELLRERGETVTTAESCTGGMLCARLTDIPGSSDVVKRAFITYCDEAKHEMLGVKKETLAEWTAVSSRTAFEMAQGAACRAGAQAALSVTGYAGPPSVPDDPDNGLVYIGCFYRGNTTVMKYRFEGNRSCVREQAVDEALMLLYAVMTGDKS